MCRIACINFMAINITQDDVKTNILILHAFRKSVSGGLSYAAERLVTIFSTQLTDKSKRELADVGFDLEPYLGKFEL